VAIYDNGLNPALPGYDPKKVREAQNPPVMAVDSFTAPPAVVLPPPTVPTAPSEFVGRLEPVVKQANEGLIEVRTREVESRNDVLNRLLARDTQNMQGTYDDAFRDAGGNDYLKQFTDATTRLAQLQGKFRSAAQAVSGAQGQSKVFEGAQLSELSRQEAVEVGNQALVVQALQGNLDSARQIAMDTARFASEDRQAELQDLLAQYQALDGIVQGQEAQLIDAQKRKAQAELEELTYTRELSLAAISSGMASVEEMQSLTSLDVDDFTKQQIAQQIIARGAAEQRQFTLEDRALERMNTLSVIGNRGSSGSGGGSGGGAGSVTGSTGITGPDGKPLKLTATQADALTGFDNTISLAEDAAALIKTGVQTGPVAGRTLGLKKLVGGADPRQMELEQKLAKLKADFMKSLSGAAVSEQEVKRLEKFLPSITDQEDVIMSKLNTLSQESLRTKTNFLNTLGATAPAGPVAGEDEYQQYLNSIK